MRSQLILRYGLQITIILLIMLTKDKLGRKRPNEHKDNLLDHMQIFILIFHKSKLIPCGIFIFLLELFRLWPAKLQLSLLGWSANKQLSLFVCSQDWNERDEISTINGNESGLWSFGFRQQHYRSLEKVTQMYTQMCIHFP